MRGRKAEARGKLRVLCGGSYVCDRGQVFMRVVGMEGGGEKGGEPETTPGGGVRRR